MIHPAANFMHGWLFEIKFLRRTHKTAGMCERARLLMRL
jgi:hypothetical protein